VGLVLGLLLARWHLPFWILLDSFDQFGAGYLVLDCQFILPLAMAACPPARQDPGASCRAGRPQRPGRARLRGGRGMGILWA
jgi:hypothetical protein